LYLGSTNSAADLAFIILRSLEYSICWAWAYRSRPRWHFRLSGCAAASRLNFRLIAFPNWLQHESLDSRKDAKNCRSNTVRSPHIWISTLRTS